DLWFAKIPGLKPRYVLYFIGINDRAISADSVSGPDSLTYDIAYKRVRAYVENNSAMIRAARVLRGWVAARRIGVHHGGGKAGATEGRWVPAQVPPDLAARLRQNLDAYRQRLRALHARTIDFGATPIYVTQINGDGRIAGGTIYEIEGSGGGKTFAELA